MDQRRNRDYAAQPCSQAQPFTPVVGERVIKCFPLFDPTQVSSGNSNFTTTEEPDGRARTYVVISSTYPQEALYMVPGYDLIDVLGQYGNGTLQLTLWERVDPAFVPGA